MIVGIDASNIRSGGGFTHLRELLAAAQPQKHRIRKVIVWGGSATLDKLREAPWLEKRCHPWLDRSLPYRASWQRWQLPRLAQRAGCAVVFCPGGLVSKGIRPVVTMCQNLLPFEWREMRRYKLSRQFFRLLLLRLVQADSFRRADGVIFLTHYAQQRVCRVAGAIAGQTAVIPHGVNERFFCRPRAQRPVAFAREGPPFRIVYVSIVDAYKHQWHVAKAIARLRLEGLPVEVEFIGPAYGPALRRLEGVMRRVDPTGAFICYRGFVPYDQLPKVYQEADLCVFASSCENLPNILLESMAAGLPIASSNRGPMPEVLGEAGVYFDPEDSEAIARAVRQLVESPELRAEKAQMACERAQRYSWQRCADETFAFLAKVAINARSRSVGDAAWGAKGEAFRERRIDG
jgi:glycosyltransferase involved in cell wall biosynthesis